MEKGAMKVAVKDERGFTLTKNYGFTVEEEGKVLAFDAFDHPELGKLLLFGDQVFALKFWDEDQLTKGLNLVSTAFRQEAARRQFERNGNG